MTTKKGTVNNEKKLLSEKEATIFQSKWKWFSGERNL